MHRHHWVNSYCCSYKFIHLETRKERVHSGEKQKQREIFHFFIHRKQIRSFHGKSLKENNNVKTLWFLPREKEERFLLLFLHKEKPSIKDFPSSFEYTEKTKWEKPWKNTNTSHTFLCIFPFLIDEKLENHCICFLSLLATFLLS